MKILTLLALCAVFTAQADDHSDLSIWVPIQHDRSANFIIKNIIVPDGLFGTVLAAPDHGVDYYFHWVRDAALTTNTLLDLHDGAPLRWSSLGGFFADFSRLAAVHQAAPTLSGLGEPKFYVDGRPYAGEWCRPQNDGPALRALALIRMTTAWRKPVPSGQSFYGQATTEGSLKADLDFVANNWRLPSCDLWEEIMGHHFYTRMVQRKALVEGARLMREMGDLTRAALYLDQARAMEPEILKHWDEKMGYLVATLDRGVGRNKPSNLDSAVILGVLHGHTDDGFLSYSDPKVLATAEKLAAHFKALYPINSHLEIPGIAIGRYPEDEYSGPDRTGGNPWFLLTAAFAQYYYRVAEEFFHKDPTQAHAYFNLAESYLARVRYHTAADGRMDEQIGRINGYMTSARDLTWSHAETLEAIWARGRVQSLFLPATSICGHSLEGTGKAAGSN